MTGKEVKAEMITQGGDFFNGKTKQDKD